MTHRITIGFAIAASVLFASCYPYEQTPRKRDQKPTRAEIQKEAARKQEEQKKAADKKKIEARKKAAETTEPVKKTVKKTTDTTNEVKKTVTETTTPKPAAPKPKYDFATKVPGKEGYVFSPYNNKLIDVRGYPSGTLVQDPTYPASEKKYFRVP